MRTEDQKKELKEDLVNEDLSSRYGAEYYRSGCGPAPYERNDVWLSFFRGVAENIVRSLKPRKILDAGCAMGFLVESFWDLGVEAWGTDISQYAISKVRQDVQSYCSVASIAEPITGTFDLITCIEVLEHVPEALAQAATEEMCKATDVILFSSTPYDFAEPTHCNVHPLIYWVKLFSIHGFWPDLLFDAGFIAQHAMLFRRSDSPPPEDALVLFCQALHQKNALVKKSEEVTKLIEEKSRAVQDLSAQLAQKDEMLRTLSSQVVQKESAVQDLSARLAQKDEMLRTLSAQVGQKESAVQDLSARLAQKDEMLRTLSAQVGQKDSAVQELRTSLAQREEAARSLESTLNQIQSSRGWRTLQHYYRLRDKLFPVIKRRSEAKRNSWGRTNGGTLQLRNMVRRSVTLLFPRHVIEGVRLLRDMRLIAASGLFDSGWYLAQNPDVAGAGVKPLKHYLRHGAVEGRDPNPHFDSDWYLQTNPDVAKAGVNPLVHYFRRGLLEGRKPNPIGVADQVLPALENERKQVQQLAPPAELQTHKFSLIVSGCPGDALRYRSEYQAEELRFLGLTVDTALFDQVDYERVLSQYEMFFLHRVPHTPGIETFINQAKNVGKPVIFDTDDLIFNEKLIGHIKAVKDMSEDDYNLYADGVQRYHRTMSLCSAALVSTEHLRDSILELFPDMPIYINRNAVGDVMLKGADLALQLPRADDGIIRIAYLSGTRTHREDFAQCVPGLERLLRKYGMVRLMLLGHIEVPERLQRLSNQIERIPLMPWQELPAVMRRVDINLAPLELHNRFTEAKSELKYFEAGLVAVPTVATDLPAYRLAITHGDNGFLCTTEDEWFNALEQLVLDPALRARVGNKARQEVLLRYSTRARAPELGAVLREAFRQNGFRSGDRLSIAFVMRAPIAQTGGGYKNIFELGYYLAECGHDVHLYVEPIAHLSGMGEHEIIEFCHKYFGRTSAKIHVGHKAILASDIAIATNWPTAYTVERLCNTLCKAYLVQDFEPDFYDKNDSNYGGAERTYDLPLKKIAMGKYLGALFSMRDRLPVPHIRFSLDRSIYRNRNVRSAASVRILFFARPGLKRRAYPVGVEALRRVARACPEVEIAFYGMERKEDLGFDYLNLGELSREEVAREMNLSDIHLSFSLTNISWVPFEAMACGCAVVEAKVPSVELWMASDEENCLLADPEPEKVAECIVSLARDRELRNKLAANGETFVSKISSSWEDTCQDFENILYQSVMIR